MAIHFDAAGIGRDQARDHVEAGGLAGAVGTQQADNLAALDRQADGSHHRTLFVAFADAGHDQAAATFDHARTRADFGGIFRTILIVVLRHAKIMPVRV